MQCFSFIYISPSTGRRGVLIFFDILSYNNRQFADEKNISYSKNYNLHQMRYNSFQEQFCRQIVISALFLQLSQIFSLLSFQFPFNSPSLWLSFNIISFFACFILFLWENMGEVLLLKIKKVTSTLLHVFKMLLSSILHVKHWRTSSKKFLLMWSTTKYSINRSWKKKPDCLTLSTVRIGLLLR